MVVVVGEWVRIGLRFGCFVVVDPPAGMVSVREGRANKVCCTRWTMCSQFGNYSRSGNHGLDVFTTHFFVFFLLDSNNMLNDGIST